MDLEVEAHQIYWEANGCTNVLATNGGDLTEPKHVYLECPSFVNHNLLWCGMQMTTPFCI
jgi:hypothetical protein